MDDFEKMDAEVGVMEPVPIGGVVITGAKSSVPATSTSNMDYRDTLVREYHKGEKSLVERLEAQGRTDSEALLTALIHEVLRETDHLLGNELIATQNGDHRDSSVISYKRVEAIEKAIKAVTAKNALEKESGINVDSPNMMVIFQFFMSKTNVTLVKMNVADEMKDIFFSTIGDEMESWKKELKEKFKQLRTGG